MQTKVNVQLHQAALNGHFDACVEVLAAGANVNSQMDDGVTPLHRAAYWGRMKVIKLLLDRGADVNAVTDEKETPLHHAAQGRVDHAVLRTLLDAGAQAGFVPENPPVGYLTPFQAAVRAGAPATVEFFLRECGEDSAQRTAAGKTMLQLAGPATDVKALLRSMKTGAAVKTAMEGNDDLGSPASKHSPRGMSPL